LAPVPVLAGHRERFGSPSPPTPRPPAAVPSLATTWAAEHTLSATRKVVGLQPQQRQQHQSPSFIGRGRIPPSCSSSSASILRRRAIPPRLELSTSSARQQFRRGSSPASHHGDVPFRLGSTTGSATHKLHRLQHSSTHRRERFRPGCS
uniref:Uncharacterized protein n=1 Tax=Anopheles coluzzii TaxID=1518534 RepID=A0A8W7PD99_ANOCL